MNSMNTNHYFRDRSSLHQWIILLIKLLLLSTDSLTVTQFECSKPTALLISICIRYANRIQQRDSMELQNKRNKFGMNKKSNQIKFQLYFNFMHGIAVPRFHSINVSLARPSSILLILASSGRSINATKRGKADGIHWWFCNSDSAFQHEANNVTNFAAESCKNSPGGGNWS